MLPAFFAPHRGAQNGAGLWGLEWQTAYASGAEAPEEGRFECRSWSSDPL